MKKAITPVISIIILLLITVSLSGVGWTYLSGYYEGIISKTIKVVEGSARGNEVMIIKMGTKDIESGELKAMVNGEEVPILNPQTIEPKKSAVVRFLVPELGDTGVRLIAPGNSVSYTDNIGFGELAGMVMENGGFETDSNGDDYPDIWSHPSYASRSTDSYNGGYSLHIGYNEGEWAGVSQCKSYGAYEVGKTYQVNSNTVHIRERLCFSGGRCQLR